MAEQCECPLPVVLGLAAVVETLTLVSQGFQPFVSACCHLVRIYGSCVSVITGIFSPVRCLQVLALTYEVLRFQPGVTCLIQCAFPAVSDLMHEIKYLDGPQP